MRGNSGESSGTRKYFTSLKAYVDEGAVRLSFYKGSFHFESQEGRDSESVRIYRASIEGFEFGVDYEEYFDGMDWREAALVFEGPLPALNKRKFEFVDKNVSVGAVYVYWAASAENGLPPAGPAPVKVRDSEAWWTKDRLEREISSLKRRHKEMVSARVFGHTAKGIPIKGIFAGNMENCVAFVGTVHAGESGPELLLPCLSRLLSERPELLRRAGVAALPSVNIDERERLARGVPWYLRTNSNGVDINRNFDAEWDTVEYGYGLVSSNPGSMTYKGSRPNSEPETKAIVNFIGKAKPKAVYSFHWLASVCDGAFLAAKRGALDAAYAERAERFVLPYARGMYPGLEKASLSYGCSAGSLSSWLYGYSGIPGFDLEALPDKEAFAQRRDTTTPEILSAYRERHYDGMVSLLESMSTQPGR